VELVRTLAASPHRVALASSGDPEFTRNAVSRLGIGDAVEVVTSSEDVEASKPAADLLQVTLARMGGVRAAVLVGDTPYDVQAADRAGLPCVAVLTGGFSTAELRDAGAAVVADSPADLVEADWGRLLD
jgi:phosphoglycolate phosphatase-like HAD superfamily hydrolase